MASLQDEARRAAKLIEGLDSMTCYFGIDASHSALFQTLLRDLRPVVVTVLTATKTLMR